METTEVVLTEFMSKVQTPFLMINAGQDTIVSAKTAEEAFNKAQIADKTLIEI